MDKRMQEPEQTGTQRAAMLAMVLDKEVLASLLQHLRSEEIMRLTSAFERLVNDNKPTPEQLVAVGKTILEKVNLASATHLREAITLAFGSDGAEKIHREEGWRAIPERIKARVLADTLRNEPPQIAALALSQLPPRYSGEVLCALPADFREQTVELLTRGARVPAATLDAIRVAIEETLYHDGGLDDGDDSGARRVAEILNQVDSEIASEIVDKLRARDPKRADAIQHAMFHFHDLLKLDARSLQTVLAEVKPELLAVALKGTGEGERQPFFAALPDQVKAIVVQEIEDSGKLPLREVQAARREITDLTLQMQRDGKIYIRAEEAMVE